jgi:putative Ca2+/H+ antiporter (TMEM165/GDT1 family)
MLSIMAAAYGTVLLAELLGDRSIYTIGSLTTRFRIAHVVAGISVAFALKMAAAVLAGRALAGLSPALVAAVSSATFLVTAICLWRKRLPERNTGEEDRERWPRAATLSFGAIFLTEWADAGQIAAAALTARFGHPWLIWSAATAAMMTKGVLAVAAGAGLARRIPQKHLRIAAVGMCVLLSVLSALRIG